MLLNLLLTAAAAVLRTALAADPVVFGYLPTWQLDKLEGIDLAKYTHLSVSFAIPDADAQLSLSNAETVFSSIPPLAQGQKLLVSLGGWTGSKHLSDIFKDASKRQALQTQMIQWIRDYQLDGWDIDFEYPGRQGDSCHKFDAQADTPNFLKFLTELRDQMDSEFPPTATDGRKLITLATRFQPFDGPNGPLSDVSAFAGPVDYFNLMLYDFNGAWSDTTGPNAPVDFTPNRGLQYSFKSSIDQWIDAGIPAGKVVAGLPFYGRTVTATGDLTGAKDMYQPLVRSRIPQGDSDDIEESDPSCGGPKVFSGIWKYRNIRMEILDQSSEEPSDPWVRRFDEGTGTPWLFNRDTRDFVSYDDPQSIMLKTKHAVEKGLAGVMVWAITNDYNNELLGAIYNTM
ncbi:hypothetical protein LPJ56_005309 [Coemansia sp. RSA 2599]|nr:hypothetical protein LPJ56_005309 [Coemansia sp. RSA 2599]